MTSASELITYVPLTPSGTPLFHIKASSVEQAWANLLRDAAHMPYKTRENFEKRGYRVVECREVEAEVETLDLTELEMALLTELILRTVNDVKRVIDKDKKNPDPSFDVPKALDMTMRLGIILAKLTTAYQNAQEEDAENSEEDPVKH